MHVRSFHPSILPSSLAPFRSFSLLLALFALAGLPGWAIQLPLCWHARAGPSWRAQASGGAQESGKKLSLMLALLACRLSSESKDDQQERERGKRATGEAWRQRAKPNRSEQKSLKWNPLAGKEPFFSSLLLSLFTHSQLATGISLILNRRRRHPISAAFSSLTN